MASLLTRSRGLFSAALRPAYSSKASFVPPCKLPTPLLIQPQLQLATQLRCRLSTEAFEASTKNRKWSPLWFLVPTAVLLPSGYLYLTSDTETLEDTENLYKSKSTGGLAFSLLILKLCSFNFVVEYGPKLLEFAETHYLATPARWVVKHTFFRNFVPGETIEECEVAVDALKTNGVGVILDYSIEAGSGTKQELDKVADHIIETVRLASKEPTHAFGCLKVSGLTSFSLLERVSQLVQYYNTHPGDLPLALGGKDQQKAIAYSRSLPSAAPLASPPPPLSSAEVQELAELMERLDKICSVSYNLNVPMLIDAEQTYYQPAIDFFTLYMCKKYNHSRPIVYNTYQMYLKDSTNRLLEDIANANQQNYHLGVKLVRGAYLYGERERASRLGYADPVNPTIEDTHASYHKGVDIALANLGTVGVMIASHNEDTVKKTVEKLKDRNIDSKNSSVQFAQLYGMADHLTYGLVNNDQRVFKYVPFGPVEEVMPYLVRRMQENRGFIGSTSEKEMRLLWKELNRRIADWPHQISQTVRSTSVSGTGITK